MESSTSRVIDLTFLGAAGTVTGSKYLVELGSGVNLRFLPSEHILGSAFVELTYRGQRHGNGWAHSASSEAFRSG